MENSIRRLLGIFCGIFLAASIQAQQTVPAVKNVILMIGDGMGLTQVSAAMLESPQPLALERAAFTGFAKTYSADSKITDSAAGGTALATGHKTNNGYIGMDPEKRPLKTILERAEEKGLATGLVATYEITNATPASFIAHNESRKNEEEIALDFLKTGIDLFIGGGKRKFDRRNDGKDLLKELQAKGYRTVYTLDDVKSIDRGKVAALLADGHLPRIRAGRGDMLPEATRQALTILKNNNPEGFFVMIEGSQIDGGGHANEGETIVAELLDFDTAIREAFDFADRNPSTLVVVTADHETGGFSLPAPRQDKTVPGYKFGTSGHTAVMVPVYAYGTGAEQFTGIMENTDIPKKIAALLRLE